MLRSVLEKHVESLLFHGVDQEQRMVGSNQDLELTQLICRWWHPPKHEFRIGGRRESVNLARSLTATGERPEVVPRTNRGVGDAKVVPSADPRFGRFASV